MSVRAVKAFAPWRLRGRGWLRPGVCRAYRYNACGARKELSARGEALRSMLRAGKVKGWVLLALLTLQAACGGALWGGGTRAALPRASAGFNLFSPEQDIQL